MADLMPSMTLSGAFFAEAVQPILTPMSTGHGQGLRVFFFLHEADDHDQQLSTRIASVLSHRLSQAGQTGSALGAAPAQLMWLLLPLNVHQHSHSHMSRIQGSLAHFKHSSRVN